MAIDFSNRDPKDKNGVYSVTHANRTGWIETDESGAWTGKFSSTKPANGSGWQEVGYANVVMNDGRTFRAVLDESGQPISEVGDSTGTDSDRANAFAREQAQAGRADQEGDTRGPQTNPNREVYRGGKWVVEPNPVYQPTTAAGVPGRPQGGSRNIEGTPDPSKPGGADNERPRWVIRDAQNAEIFSEPVVGKDLDDWREERERSRNPAGRSDRELREEAEKAEAKARQAQLDDERRAQQNKPSAPTLRPDGRGGTIAVQAMPDGTIRSTPLPGAYGEPDRVTVDNVVYERGQDGTYKPAQGIAPPSRGGKLPVGITPPRFSRGNVASELTRFADELDRAVTRGDISKEDAAGFYAPYHQAGQTFLGEVNYADTQDQNAVGAQLNQRGQNLSQANSRLGWTNSAFQNAMSADNQLLMGAAGSGRSVLVPLLALQAGLANAAGGLREAPEVEIRRYPPVGVGGPPLPASIAPAAGVAERAASGLPAPLLPPHPMVDAATASAAVNQGRGAATPEQAMPALPRSVQPAVMPSLPVAPGADEPNEPVRPSQTPVPITPPSDAALQSSMVPRSIQPVVSSGMRRPPEVDIDSIISRMLADGVDPIDAMEIRRRHLGLTA